MVRKSLPGMPCFFPVDMLCKQVRPARPAPVPTQAAEIPPAMPLMPDRRAPRVLE